MCFRNLSSLFAAETLVGVLGWRDGERWSALAVERTAARIIGSGSLQSEIIWFEHVHDTEVADGINGALRYNGHNYECIFQKRKISLPR